MIETLRSVMRFRRFELDPVARRLAKAANVHDLRLMARRRLPRGVFDYIDGGAEDEHTMGENTAAFRRIGFHPRILQGVGHARPVDHAARASRSRSRWCWRPPASPASPTPTASSRWRAPRPGPACRTR